MSSHKTFSLSSVPFHAIWKPRNCIAGISSKKKMLLLVKLSRWRAKKSGPKFKMKIVFCISTNIQHDMHCFCFPELNVEPGIPKPASRSREWRGGTRRARCPSVRCLGVLLCTSVFYITNTTKAL